MINLFNYFVKKKNIENTPNPIYQVFELSINKAAALAKSFFCLERAQPSKPRSFFHKIFYKKPKRNTSSKKCLIMRASFIACATLGIVYFQPRIFKFISSSFRKNNISYLEKIKIQANKASQDPIIVVGVGLVALMRIAGIFKVLNYKRKNYVVKREVTKLKEAQKTLRNNNPINAVEVYKAAQLVYQKTLEKIQLSKKEDPTNNNELLLAAKNAYESLQKCLDPQLTYPGDMVKIITKLPSAAKNVYYALLKTDANDDEKLEALELVREKYREAIVANRDRTVKLQLINELNKFNVFESKRFYHTLINNKPDQESESEVASYNKKLIDAAKKVYQAILKKMQANQNIDEKDSNELIDAAKNVYYALLKTDAENDDKEAAAEAVLDAYKDAIEASKKTKSKNKLTKDRDQFVNTAKQELGLGEDTDTPEASVPQYKEVKPKKKKVSWDNASIKETTNSKKPSSKRLKKAVGRVSSFLKSKSQILRRKKVSTNSQNT